MTHDPVNPLPPRRGGYQPTEGSQPHNPPPNQPGRPPPIDTMKRTPLTRHECAMLKDVIHRAITAEMQASGETRQKFYRNQIVFLVRVLGIGITTFNGETEEEQ